MSDDTPPKAYDFAGVIAVTLLLLLLTLLTFLGSSFAVGALPFVAGATVGYYLARLPFSSAYPNWVRTTAGFVVAVVITALGLALVPSLVDFG